MDEALIEPKHEHLLLYHSELAMGTEAVKVVVAVLDMVFVDPV